MTDLGLNLCTLLEDCVNSTLAGALIKRKKTYQSRLIGLYFITVLYPVITAEAGGFEPPVRKPVRQFSKLVVSATHPHFLRTAIIGIALQRYILFFNKQVLKLLFFQKKILFLRLILKINHLLFYE